MSLRIGSFSTTPLLFALLVATAALAGCHAPADPDGTTDGGDGGDTTDFLPTETGATLTSTEIAAIQGAYDDQPLSDSQSPWPGHRIKWVSEDTFIFTHWNDDNPANATNLNWIGVGKKGVFCSEDRPGDEDQWRHFHKYDAPTYNDGHGGEAGDSGYWLLHVAVRDGFEAPWGTVNTGVDHSFMLTPAPDCGAEYTVHKAAMDHGGEGGATLGSAEIADIQAAYPDQPLSDSQSAWPGHRISWVSDDTFIFTHWNNADPAAADNLNWIGVGKAGIFCADDRPGLESEWRHFHSYDAPTYDDGHGGEPEETGYWLLHVGVRDQFNAPWGKVDTGVDEMFMHTPAPTC